MKTTWNRLRHQYCIVGVGNTSFTREGSRSTRSLATESILAALDDAGLSTDDVDGILSYQVNDSVSSSAVAQDLGLSVNLWKDTFGGGGSTETLIGMAVGAIEVGMCHTVVIFRAMNGYSEARMGGGTSTHSGQATPVTGSSLDLTPYGCTSPAQLFGLTFARHMYEFGTTSEQLAMVKVHQSEHATMNPKALQSNPVTVEDVLASPWVVKPACHRLDCCLETNNGTAIIVTSADRARDLRRPPVYIDAVLGRFSRPFGHSAGIHTEPMTRQGGQRVADRIFGMARLSPNDIQLTSAYDAFTFTPVMLFEAYGFCEVGQGGEYVSSDITRLDGARPNNTAGGQLCEGYSHGMNLVMENVRQLRHQVDDFCTETHSFERGPGGCRQVRDVETAMSLGWVTPAGGSALILTN